MKKIIISIISIFVAFNNINAQSPSGVTVKFADSKFYSAKMISETPSTIKLEFLHSKSVYEFNIDGKILSSTGQYPKGQKVKMILIRDADKSIYNLSTLGYVNDFVGIKFSDGKVYFCKIMTSEANSFNCIFTHTYSFYTMKKEDNMWRVYSTDKGAYPKGHVLIDIYSLAPRRFFFNDGGNYVSGTPDFKQED